MHRNVYRATVTVLLAFAAWNARAGTVIVQQGTSPGKSQPPEKVTIYVDSGKLRIEQENGGAGRDVVIFDQAKQVLWIVNPADQTYFELTPAQVQSMANQMQGMSGQMQQMMQQMQAQMAKMPPEQRAQMEAMIQQRMGAMGGGAAAPPQITVQQKATGQKVGQFNCTRYDVLVGTNKTQEICAASVDELKLDPSVMETFKALNDFFLPVRRQLPQDRDWMASALLDQIQGFPVQTVVYADGKPSMEWDQVSVDNKSLDAGLFVLPAGLKKTEMPGMSGMPGMGGPGK